MNPDPNPELKKITKRLTTIIVSLMHDCPALSNDHVINAMMRAGYREITAKCSVGYYRARANELLGDEPAVVVYVTEVENPSEGKN